jgi:hypothetical protein
MIFGRRFSIGVRDGEEDFCKCQFGVVGEFILICGGFVEGGFSPMMALIQQGGHRKSRFRGIWI